MLRGKKIKSVGGEKNCVGKFDGFGGASITFLETLFRVL